MKGVRILILLSMKISRINFVSLPITLLLLSALSGCGGGADQSDIAEVNESVTEGEDSDQVVAEDSGVGIEENLNYDKNIDNKTSESVEESAQSENVESTVVDESHLSDPNL